jgi:hypothetical protein
LALSLKAGNPLGHCINAGTTPLDANVPGLKSEKAQDLWPATHHHFHGQI